MWCRERAEAECTGVAAAPYCSRSFQVGRGADGLFVCERE